MKQRLPIFGVTGVHLLSIEPVALHFENAYVTAARSAQDSVHKLILRGTTQGCLHTLSYHPPVRRVSYSLTNEATNTHELMLRPQTDCDWRL